MKNQGVGDECGQHGLIVCVSSSLYKGIGVKYFHPDYKSI